MGKQRKAFRHGDRPALKQAGGRRALAGRHVPFMKERGDGRCGRMRAERFGKERAAVRRFLWQADLKRELHGRKSCWPGLSKKRFPMALFRDRSPFRFAGPGGRYAGTDCPFIGEALCLSPPDSPPGPSGVVRKTVKEALPCTECSDAKQPRHSGVRAVRLTERTYRACPCIEARPIVPKGFCSIPANWKLHFSIFKQSIQLFRKAACIQLPENILLHTT